MLNLLVSSLFLFVLDTLFAKLLCASIRAHLSIVHHPCTVSVPQTTPAAAARYRGAHTHSHMILCSPFPLFVLLFVCSSGVNRLDRDTQTHTHTRVLWLTVRDRLGTNIAPTSRIDRSRNWHDHGILSLTLGIYEILSWAQLGRTHQFETGSDPKVHSLFVPHKLQNSNYTSKMPWKR